MKDPYLAFERWLNEVLPKSSPNNVVAYNFNLAECGDWIVEIIGATSFDENDEEWACPPEAWSSRPKEFTIPRDAAPHWELAQQEVSHWVTSFLATSRQPCADVLRQAQAVCVGFVDGNLARIWPITQASAQV